MAKKKEFHEELPTKVCPVCGGLSMEAAEICDHCGHSFVPEKDAGGSATPGEAQDIEALFQELESMNDDPQNVEGSTSDEPVQEIDLDDALGENYVEDDIESTLDESPEEPGEPADEGLKCPKCGAEIDEETVFCPTCGEQIREGEVSVKALVEGLTEDFSLVTRADIDFEKATPGEEIIVRKAGDKYEAITAPVEAPVKVVDVTEKEAEVLKADYILRKTDTLSVRDIVEAGATLRDNPEYLEKYYGNSNIDEIYGAGLTDYANVNGTKVDLLDIGLPVNILQILSELGAKAQTELGGILKRYEVDELTPTSAKLIVDSDRTEETMRDIVVREKTMQTIVKDYVDMVIGQ